MADADVELGEEESLWGESNGVQGGFFEDFFVEGEKKEHKQERNLHVFKYINI